MPAPVPRTRSRARAVTDRGSARRRRSPNPSATGAVADRSAATRPGWSAWYQAANLPRPRRRWARATRACRTRGCAGQVQRAAGRGVFVHGGVVDHDGDGAAGGDRDGRGAGRETARDRRRRPTPATRASRPVARGPARPSPRSRQGACRQLPTASAFGVTSTRRFAAGRIVVAAREPDPRPSHATPVQLRIGEAPRATGSPPAARSRTPCRRAGHHGQVPARSTATATRRLQSSGASGSVRLTRCGGMPTPAAGRC
jgi:hypothetical protein